MGAQHRFWCGAGAKRFATTEVDAVTERLVELAAPRPGHRVLDVGCGAGTTCRILRELVGDSGRVVGIDISPPLLAAASEAAPGVELVHADAATHPYARASFDLVFSRFGMTFFDDPDAAFANLRRAVASKGRLVFACYGPNAENGWLAAILAAARAAAPGWRAPRIDRGPFAFHDRARLHALLAGARFGRIEIEPFATREVLARTSEATLTQVLERPVMAAIVETVPADKRPALRKHLRTQLRAWKTREGYASPVTHWLVRAKPG